MAELFLQRHFTNDIGTPGTLFFGDSQLFTVEDPIREPKTGRPVDYTTLESWVATWKIKERTAIISGRYRVLWTWSNRFKRYTLELQRVPGWAGIRVHSGHDVADTAGCIIPGTKRDPNGTDVLGSRDGVLLFESYVRVLIGEGREVWLNVKNPTDWGF